MTNTTNTTAPAAEPAIKDVKFSAVYQMEVSKTVKGAAGKPATREKLGTVEVPMPILADLGIDAEVKETDKDSGLPVYADPIHDLLYNALFDSVTKAARNRLNGLELKNPALPLASTLAEFVAVNRSNNLGLINSFKRVFKTWVMSLGKSAEAQAKLIAFSTADNLALASESDKAKFLPYLDQFSSVKEHEQYEDFILKLAEIAEAKTIAADDF